MMGSKFSLPTGPQKPPKVCKKPPLSLPDSPPTWQNWPLSGLVMIHTEGSAVNVDLNGPLTLYPTPGFPTHDGTLDAQPFTVDVTLTAVGLTPLLTFKIDLYENAFPVGSWQVLNVPAQDLDPFDSGLITLLNDPPTDMIYCRAWW